MSDVKLPDINNTNRGNSRGPDRSSKNNLLDGSQNNVKRSGSFASMGPPAKSAFVAKKERKE